jgi:hypothetical protein
VKTLFQTLLSKFNLYRYNTVRRDVGYPFSPCEPDELRRAMDRAFKCYRKNRGGGKEDKNGGGRRRGGTPANHPRGNWERKQMRAMTRDLSWAQAAEKYERVFKGAALPPAPPPPPPLGMGQREHEREHGAAGGLCIGGDQPAAAAAAQRDDQHSEHWEQAARRAERVRLRASSSPDADSRTQGGACTSRESS